jgi:hypothetical protein
LYSYYGTVNEANTYFENRLYSTAWTSSNTTDRTNALIGATQIIDRLNFSGEKATVYDILYDSDGDLVDPAPSDADVRAAYLSQELEFPRGTDTNVPDEIKMACWEIAYALLDGVDPDMEAENLAVIGQTISSVRTTYDRNNVSMAHIANGVPSAKAWRLLKPFLRDFASYRMSRVS